MVRPTMKTREENIADEGKWERVDYKLFYIFIIIILLTVISKLVAEVQIQSEEMDKQVRVQNKVVTTHHKIWSRSMKERENLKIRSQEQEAFIEALQSDLAGIQHDFVTVQVENIALKKWLDSSAKNP